ncbi:hypothetical protein ACRRTK_024571 [Alexandromys fortis]
MWGQFSSFFCHLEAHDITGDRNSRALRAGLPSRRAFRVDKLLPGPEKPANRRARAVNSADGFRVFRLRGLLRGLGQLNPKPGGVSGEVLAPGSDEGLPQQSSPQQLLNLQGTHSASLLNGSMLQRALLLQQLQGNLRAYNMTAPSLPAPSLTPPQMVTPNLQQFFPQATRQSLLGPPPVGVPMNPSQLSHSGRNSQKQARTPSTTPNHKTVPLGDREDPTEGSEETAELQMDTPEDQDSLVCPDDMETPVLDPEPFEASEPPAKRPKRPGHRGQHPHQHKCQLWPVPQNRSHLVLQKLGKMWGAGGSLKVTILQSSDSRAFNTTPLTSGLRPGDSTSAAPVLASIPSKQTLQFFCYICKTSCNSQQEFQDHLSEGQHQQRLGEMQHSSQTCLLSLLPMPRDILEREAEDPPPKRWCNTCQMYYMGDLIQHRRTQEHKIAKQSLRPFCTICSRYFKTPRKFVEHVKSQGHKDKAKELKTLEKEIVNPEEEHFITVDAVGCFESDQEEDEDDEEEEEIEAEEEFCKQVRSGDTSLEEWKGSETYSPNTAYGVDFLVPAMGYVCRICHKFYDTNSGLRLSHCKSLAHFENLQKYKAAKNPSPASRPVSRRCAINARNALTALFTSSSSNGRLPSQPSSQDTAKIPSKVKPGCPKPPPSLRRSARLKT